MPPIERAAIRGVTDWSADTPGVSAGRPSRSAARGRIGSFHPSDVSASPDAGEPLRPGPEAPAQENGLLDAQLMRLERSRVHRTRRIATVEARVRDGDGNLVAMGTGTFRIFEKRGDPIV